MLATQTVAVGVNQRAQIKMTDTEVDAYLRERNTAAMATIGPSGAPHVVAMWYGFVGGRVAVETKAKSQKVQNLRRDPRMTLMMESGAGYEELRGVELVGRAEISEDPDVLWELGVSVFERYYGPVTKEMEPLVHAMLHNRVVVLLNVERVASWDHRKLGLAMPSSMDPASASQASGAK